MTRIILSTLLLAGCAAHVEQPSPAALQAEALQEAGTGCPEPLLPLESGSCVALPEDAHAETPVLVYLHGMTSSPEMARISAGILAQAAIPSGIAVLAPLGAPGNCNWRPEVLEYFCWPGGLDQGEAADRLIESLEAELRLVQLRLGRESVIRPVLVGYSNGGFMAMRIIGRSTDPFAALIVVHAGEPKVYTYPSSPPLPTLLRAAEGDNSHFPTMEALREALLTRGWKPEWSVREGEHRFTESDAAAIVDFLSR